MLSELGSGLGLGRESGRMDGLGDQARFNIQSRRTDRLPLKPTIVYVAAIKPTISLQNPRRVQHPDCIFKPALSIPEAVPWL